MDKGPGGGGGGGDGGGGGGRKKPGGGSASSSSRSSSSSSRATSAGSSPSCSSSSAAAAGRGVPGVPGTPGVRPPGEPVLEGVLSKYTNLLQGWQNRYFMLDFESGILQYFVNEQSKSQKPRGALSLAGAIVSLSDEAPHMLVVYSANGEMYKLRAADAKEKQYWVTQLRSCAKYHMEANSKSTPSLRSRSLTLLPPGTPDSASPSSQRHLNPGGPSVVTITHHKSPAAARKVKNQCAGQLHEVREMMSQVEGQQKNLVQAIESLPGSGPITALDQDLLLLKATSAATLSCLGECLNLLQQSMHHGGQQNQKTVASGSQPEFSNQDVVPGILTPNSILPRGLQKTMLAEHSRPPDSDKVSSTSRDSFNTVSAGEQENILGWQGPKSHSSEQLKNGALGSLPSAGTSTSWAITPNVAQDGQTLPPDPEDTGPQLIPVEDEVTDTEDNEEEDLGVLEDQRSIILHLISQLKLGMDLTRVVLPTFILEKRSLLEMFANFMAHPDLFLSIAAGATPEERVISFVEYYLTSFHEGRKGAVAKKPYNPIIGETFHCSWHVPRDKVTSHRTSKTPSTAARAQAGPATGPEERDRADGTDESVRVDGTEKRDLADGYKLSFVAEQVSHHPPVSCFYCECKEKRICVNTHVWTKSKFMGMSIGVSMVGEGVLNLLEHEEEYVFTLPSAYARSILTVPWVELGGKVNINCAKTGYSATVTFHTKPFYGGKVHRVTAEVKHNPTNTIVCKAQGEWNGTLEFTYSNGETKVINTTTLPVIPKKIRPVAKQGPFESRHLWQHVTSSLKSGNIDAATKYKHHLEERQRTEEKQRAAVGAPWKPKYFTKEGDGWTFFNPLWKSH
ncbi:oxysterol-binding protein-related protein 10 [Tachyglossus aculeatus]|uniref:oxysterol-binding protein-related protein 10 n=1 Tax=Tachyglossus aculeatus TaxID=9261 RepID=UPI0018F3932A|nr:oxysterol-binding protein-related protein 10 [Tachyglossus aculeatus]